MSLFRYSLKIGTRFPETTGSRVNIVQLSEEVLCRYKELLFRHRGNALMVVDHSLLLCILFFPEMDVHLDIMFHHGGKFQKDENGMTIYSPDKKACVGDIDVDTLDVFWVRNYYKELGYDRIGECWWHVPGRSLDIGLRALNCDDELREMCFMVKRMMGWLMFTLSMQFQHQKFFREMRLWSILRGDHDDLREVSDEAENERLQDKTPNQANIPTVPADETPFTNNNEPMHNTSPPKTTEPTDPGANNPTPQNNNPTTTSNSNPSQATTAKPVTNTPPVPPKTKPNSNANPNPKSNNTSLHKATANPKNSSKPNPKRNRNSSDGANSWHSEEMKTPPPSEDEFSEEEPDDVFPVFRDGIQFGDLKLEVGIKFNTKSEFREAVKKVRKYPNFRQCEAAVYFKSKCDLVLNRNSISRALADARVVVYGDEKAQYAMLANHVGKLPPVVQSRLDKIRKESKSWMPIWTGNDEYEKFEVHGHPTNMVVDLGKRLCTCQFWMLTGMPCVHACAALARVNKRPEDFCHKWLTMDAYRDTYAHYVNPLPGQSLWEKSEQNRPQAPKKKKKPGPLTKKRRKDADEGNGGSKKSNVTGTLKRQLKPFTCKYCLQKGHTKRGCPKKRAADIAQALADAAAAAAAAVAKTKPTEQENAVQAPTQAPPDTPAQAHPQAPFQAAPEAPAQAPAPVDAQVVEIDLSQPNYSDAQQSQHSQEDPPARPSKLQTRRRSSTPPSGSITMDPLQGASSATSSRLANFLKFVPTPGFKPPRKKK
ncbi:hypothetical protein Ahy_B05g075480 [Arachis hypogaea]|uniref:SWIM-type domain-containing protein n=1 Tax=Arachis hypogaea TaxID=3818 RepID=A0A444Z1N6_ARAHY|nr:hypothetical protein Ahy_B05g075480 [Arachis hypogaea]